MRARESRQLMNGLAALLAGNNVELSTLDASPEELLAAGVRHDLTCLMHWRLNSLPEASGWPERLRADLAAHAFGEAAQELQQAREIACVVDALAADRIHPILFKGTPLAYTVYDAPALRPRRDTDLFIRRDQVDAVRRLLAERTYIASTLCDGEFLFCQFELSRTDEFGICHAFDFHWKISTQSVFAESLDYEELAGEAQAVPALGENARAAGTVHALLLACMHPVMHHQNQQRLLWTYDIHLLASRLSNGEFEKFTELARRKKMAAVCAHGLHLAETAFQTKVPPFVIGELESKPTEPSAAYLSADRRWHDELISSMNGLPRLGDRLRLLREVLFPDPRYMLDAYVLAGKPLGSLLLPVLYLHRNVRGAWKIVRGKK
jgi:hypothetical protein